MARVLLIEPDRLLADNYRQALEVAGHEVQVCAGAQSAIFCADEFIPEAVVLEPQLVGHSGIEFLYEFRSYVDWEHIPAIILSYIPAGEFANSWKLLREQFGVQAYHYKPLTTLHALINSVQTVLQSEVVASSSVPAAARS